MTVIEVEAIDPAAPYQDGNYKPLDDVRLPEPGEPQDFLLDSEGNEVRAGDFVRLIRTHSWSGSVARVRSIERGTVYLNHRAVRRREENEEPVRAWSPTSSCNTVRIVRGRSEWGARVDEVVKVNMTAQDEARYRISELLENRRELGASLNELQRQISAIDYEVEQLRLEYPNAR